MPCLPAHLHGVAPPLLLQLRLPRLLPAAHPGLRGQAVLAQRLRPLAQPRRPHGLHLPLQLQHLRLHTGHLLLHLRQGTRQAGAAGQIGLMISKRRYTPCKCERMALSMLGLTKVLEGKLYKASKLPTPQSAHLLRLLSKGLAPRLAPRRWVCGGAIADPPGRCGRQSACLLRLVRPRGHGDDRQGRRHAHRRAYLPQRLLDALLILPHGLQGGVQGHHCTTNPEAWKEVSAHLHVHAKAGRHRVDHVAVRCMASLRPGGSHPAPAPPCPSAALRAGPSSAAPVGGSRPPATTRMALRCGPREGDAWPSAAGPGAPSGGGALDSAASWAASAATCRGEMVEDRNAGLAWSECGYRNKAICQSWGRGTRGQESGMLASARLGALAVATSLLGDRL